VRLDLEQRSPGGSAPTGPIPFLILGFPLKAAPAYSEVLWVRRSGCRRWLGAPAVRRNSSGGCGCAGLGSKRGRDSNTGLRNAGSDLVLRLPLLVQKSLSRVCLRRMRKDDCDAMRLTVFRNEYLMRPERQGGV